MAEANVPLVGTTLRLKPSFLGVPGEIRMLIYDKLVNDRVFWVSFPHDGCLHSRILGSLAILRVNRQVRAEAKRVLRVRTLRVNKCNMVDVKLFPRIPRIISHWTSTIESVLVGYHQYEFNALIGRSDRVRQERLLSALKEIILHLPKLVALNLTCNNLPGRSQDRELEGAISTFSKDLSASLPQLNRIQIFTADKQCRGGENELEVEMKLFKAVPHAERQPSDIPQISTSDGHREPNARQVLLDVIKSSDSKTVHWLTINEVNQ